MTTPEFAGRAALKGGGFGILGDIVSRRSGISWGGFLSIFAGPVPRIIGDVWNLTFRMRSGSRPERDTKLRQGNRAVRQTVYAHGADASHRARG